MAEIPIFSMLFDQEKQEEQLAELLQAFSDASGIPLEDIMASEFEEAIEPEFVTGEIGAEELEKAEEIFDLENEYSGETGDYLDELMNDLDVDPSDEDAYPDGEV